MSVECRRQRRSVQGLLLRAIEEGRWFTIHEDPVTQRRVEGEAQIKCVYNLDRVTAQGVGKCWQVEAEVLFRAYGHTADRIIYLTDRLAPVPPWDMEDDAE